MGIVMPMVLLFLFGYALTLDVDKVPFLIWDQNPTPTSRDFISQFKGSRYFSFRGSVSNYREIEGALDREKALLAMVLPWDFESRVQTGKKTSVQAIVDGSDANTASIILGYIQAINQKFSRTVINEYMLRTQGKTMPIPLEIRPRVLFNPDMKSKNFIIPGLIAVIMMVIAALLTSLTMAREWETGTMEQLISTPIKVPELIWGKLIPYLGIGLLDVILAVLVGEFVFNVPLRGSVALLFSIASVFLIGAMALGMLISIIAKTQLLASQVAMVVTFLPAMLLSGFIYYIKNMPNLVQYFTYLVPARYFVTILKGIYLKGVGLKILTGEVFLLLIFGFVVIFFAQLKFKKNLG